MAFRQSAPAPRQPHFTPPIEDDVISKPLSCSHDQTGDLQEWILFSPSQAASSTIGTHRERTNYTIDRSRLSDFGSLGTVSRPAGQHPIDSRFTEDRELDSLDDGLQAFREPSLHRLSSTQGPGAVLPAHDGLGTFPESSTPVQDQLRERERYNPKRKFEEDHSGRLSVQKRLGTIGELESQISDEKRFRIEKWRIEQSQALLSEIEMKARTDRYHKATRHEANNTRYGLADEEGKGKPTQTGSHGTSTSAGENEENEPFWRKITRRFVRDVIGIDEPLLSIIMGETLPEDIRAVARINNASHETRSTVQYFSDQDTWPDRLLHRIARELGLLIHEISPHESRFKPKPAMASLDYAGIPITNGSSQNRDLSQRSDHSLASSPIALFPPSVTEPSHTAFWDLDDSIFSQQVPSAATLNPDAEKSRKEQQYWERELDIKMAFQFLKSRFYSNCTSREHDVIHQPVKKRDDSIRRADVIRRHHPLVKRARQPPIGRLRKEPTLLAGKLPSSSCASESVRSGFKYSIGRSATSSHDFWDIGESVASESLLASGGMMGVWGEV